MRNPKEPTTAAYLRTIEFYAVNSRVGFHATAADFIVANFEWENNEWESRINEREEMLQGHGKSMFMR